MKTKLIAGLIVALMLVVTMAVPAMAVEVGKGATVTVNEYISFTVTDPGATGLVFGSLDPGDDDQPEAAQNSSGAVTLTVAAETNVDCNIQVKATDFTGTGGTLAITNAKYGITSVLGSAIAFVAADTYYTLDTSSAGTAKIVDVWHWLTIPSGQVAGSYSSTFTYQAIKQT